MAALLPVTLLLAVLGQRSWASPSFPTSHETMLGTGLDRVGHLPQTNAFVHERVVGCVSAPPSSRRRWNHGIVPFEVDPSLAKIPESLNSILGAMRDWEQNTCIRFIARTVEEHYLEFYRGSLCWANIGRSLSSRTQISIGRGCEFQHVITHEIGHVLGLNHELCRADRDAYIRIAWENLEDWVKPFFNSTSSGELLDVPYDYDSIMHYPFDAFSKNGLDTLVPTQYQTNNRPYTRVSSKDASRVSRMYNCPAITRWRVQRRLQTFFYVGMSKTAGHPSFQLPIRKCESSAILYGEGVLCYDRHPLCRDWANAGHCISNMDYMRETCLLSCNVTSCDKSIVRPNGHCSEPLGIASIGGKAGIPNSAITASSEFRTENGWRATADRARLYMEDDAGANLIGGWCIEKWTDFATAYVQVDLGGPSTVTHIATQGRDKSYEFLSQFRVSYSLDGVQYLNYTVLGKTKILDGNCDCMTPALNKFVDPITARYVRIHPWRANFPCLRFELYGCKGSLRTSLYPGRSYRKRS